MYNKEQIRGDAFKQFCETNFPGRDEEHSKYEADLGVKSEEIPGAETAGVHITKVNLAGAPKESFIIGLVNQRLKTSNFKNSLHGNPNLEHKRLNEFSEIINQSVEGECDMLVFPEICIPYSWINWVASLARKNDMCIIFGAEHWTVGDVAYNFVVTILPVKVHGIMDCHISVRLKNHYSHKEVELIKGYDLKPASTEKDNTYEVFDWRGLCFSVFNCFELTDIAARGVLRSHVDLIVAIEANKDVNYFSNIIESVARDVHCYVAQVNDSRYGDSRITRPTSTATKDLAVIKGGRNTVLLVEEIKVKALRQFQAKKYNLQQDPEHNRHGFKPTPPHFDHKAVRERLNKAKHEL
jgi:predicted amidohydrolase